jgi:hypothetical protein
MKLSTELTVSYIISGENTMKRFPIWLLPTAAAFALGIVTHAWIDQSATAANLMVAQETSPTPSESSSRDGRGHRHRIDFAAAAAQLGTTEATLKAALGVPEHRGPDLAAAAMQLGITEAQLREALGLQLDPQTGEIIPPETRPDLPAAAATLGVSEEALRTALGRPDGEGCGPGGHHEGGGRHGGRPRLDIAGAAAQLGVSEQQVIEALGLPPRPDEQSEQSVGQ